MHFKTLCHFWQTLGHQAGEQRREQTIRSWLERFSSHEQGDMSDLLALSSCLFPNRRPDRVYGLREKLLANIAIRAWAVGTSRAQRLHEWEPRQNAPDFAATVQMWWVLVLIGCRILDLRACDFHASSRFIWTGRPMRQQPRINTGRWP